MARVGPQSHRGKKRKKAEFVVRLSCPAQEDQPDLKNDRLSSSLQIVILLSQNENENTKTYKIAGFSLCFL